MRVNFDDKNAMMKIELPITDCVDLVNLFHRLKSNSTPEDIAAATNFIGILTDKVEVCHGMCNTGLFSDAYVGIVKASKTPENFNF